MKLINLFLAVVFFFSGYLQLNDPDPLYWVTTYLAAGIVAGLWYFDHSSTIFTAIVAGLAIAGLLYTFPGLIEFFHAGQYSSLFEGMRYGSYVEEAREFFGLVIVTATLTFYLNRQKS